MIRAHSYHIAGHCCVLMAILWAICMIVGGFYSYHKFGPDVKAAARMASKHPGSMVKLERVLDAIDRSGMKSAFGNLVAELRKTDLHQMK